MQFGQPCTKFLPKVRKLFLKVQKNFWTLLIIQKYFPRKTLQGRVKSDLKTCQKNSPKPATVCSDTGKNFRNDQFISRRCLPLKISFGRVKCSSDSHAKILKTKVRNFSLKLCKPLKNFLSGKKFPEGITCIFCSNAVLKTFPKNSGGKKFKKMFSFPKKPQKLPWTQRIRIWQPWWKFSNKLQNLFHNVRKNIENFYCFRK